MHWFSLLKFALHLRTFASILLSGLFVSTQSMAWQDAGFQPYYRPAPYYYYPKPVYYQNYYPAHYSAQPAESPVTLKGNDPDNSKHYDRPLNQDISAKKQNFIQRLLPDIQNENARLRQVRDRATQLLLARESNRRISGDSKAWLQKLAINYRIKGNPVENQDAAKQLLQKIDIIPASLTLAQAANESAWGKSRFATQANNYFGIWTYDKSKGLIPAKREADKKHLVRKFEHLGDSVRYYMHMLNSHPAYQELRVIRQQARTEGRSPDGLEMATGLKKYSARGEEYIQLIQDLIRQNRWARLDNINQSA